MIERIEGNIVGPDGKMLTEDVEIWMRDILELIQELLENITYGDQLVFAPAEEFVGANNQYDNMWTGEWWLKLQVSS